MKMTSFSINGRTVSRLSINGREVSLKQEPVVLCDALCFTAQEPGSTVALVKGYAAAPTLNLQTSINGRAWTVYNQGDTITLANAGDKVYFKAIGSNDRVTTGTSAWNRFVMSGKIAVSGNVNSLLREDEDEAETVTLGTFCYLNLFNGQDALIDASQLRLPSMNLASGCYRNMFIECHSLVGMPELPAINATGDCYRAMFQNCTSLERAANIAITALASACCESMFQGCSKLNYIKVNFTNWDPSGATRSWLPDNAGTFECPWDLITNTSTRTTSTVPSSWTMVAV